MLLARIFFGDIEYNVIFNSVNLEKFAPKMSKNNDDLTFIHVGRYTYQKEICFKKEDFDQKHFPKGRFFKKSCSIRNRKCFK